MAVSYRGLQKKKKKKSHAFETDKKKQWVKVYGFLLEKKYCSLSDPKVRVEVPTTFTGANNVACTAGLTFD